MERRVSAIFPARQVDQVLLTTAASHSELYPVIGHAPCPFRRAANGQAGDVGTADEWCCNGDVNTVQGVKWVWRPAYGDGIVSSGASTTDKAVGTACEKSPPFLAVARATLIIAADHCTLTAFSVL